MSRSLSIDVSELPEHTLGGTTLLWWGELTMILIESVMFALALATYFYLRTVNVSWPPPTVATPGLGLGTITLVVVLVSAVPFALAARRAHMLDLSGARRWLIIGVLFFAAMVVLRFLEYAQLDYKWNDHVYGSIIWVLLGLHLFHILGAGTESVVVWTRLVVGPVEPKHFHDVELAVLYWFFVVAWWVPLYVVIYWGPRIFR